MGMSIGQQIDVLKRRRVYSKILGKVDHLKMVDKTLPIAQLEAVDKTLTELLEAVGEKP